MSAWSPEKSVQFDNFAVIQERRAVNWVPN